MSECRTVYKWIYNAFEWKTRASVGAGAGRNLYVEWTNKLANVRQSIQNLIDDSSHDDDSYKLIRLHNNQVNDFD